MSEVAAKTLGLSEHKRTLKAAQRDQEPPQVETEGKAVLNAARRVVDVVGLQEVAWDLGLNAANLGHMLKGRNGSYFRLAHAPYLLRKAPDVELANALLSPAGLHAMPVVVMTPEEKLARLEATLAEHLGPDLRSAIYERAWRR